MAKSKKINKSTNLLSQIKWGESYTSLLLGSVVVVVILFLFLSFFKGKNILTQETGSTSTTENAQNSELSMNKKTYVVKAGDDLWHIAENLYGSGYNWVDLASVNNLSDPGIIYVGTRLTIPNVKKRVLTPTENIQQEIVIKGSSYVVQKGDYLWDIAIRAYGDGYKWTDIANANNISNPDVIDIGLVLKLPR